MKSLQSIPVDRSSEESRLKVFDLIDKRVVNTRLPPILIYPEGTTKAPRFLLEFKKGAFRGGHPVNPVLLNFQNSRAYASQEFIGTFHDIYSPCCNFINFLKVDILPMYKPSREEIEDPGLYSKNVRAVMFEKLKSSNNTAVLSGRSFEDVKLAWKFKEFTADLCFRNTKDSIILRKLGNLSVEKIFKQTGFRTKKIASLLALFHELALKSQNDNFILHIDIVVEILKYELNKEQIIKICRYINRSWGGIISPMDFLTLCSYVEGTNVNTENTIQNQLQILFHCIDRDQQGFLSSEDIKTFFQAEITGFSEKKDGLSFDDFAVAVQKSEENRLAILRRAKSKLLLFLKREAPVFIALNDLF